MKLVIIGAGGFRTPLLIKTLYKKFLNLSIDKIVLYDIDRKRQELINDLISSAIPDEIIKNNIFVENNAHEALRGADFVITTFRVGGMEGRVKDEKIPLNYGILGQETTGPGGFSMALRSISVMLAYLDIMREVCPDAWIINFANPSGLMTEAILKLGRWNKVLGICDGPESIRLFVAEMLGVSEETVSLDYFGLNHLGWVRRILVNGMDILPAYISQLDPHSKLPGLPFSGRLVKSLGMIPNEYLYYYYYRMTAVESILCEEKTRGETLLEKNRQLELDLAGLHTKKNYTKMWDAYWIYLDERTQTYMQYAKDEPVKKSREESHLGYANVAYTVIYGLTSGNVNALVNLPNLGAISGMGDDDVVEIPVEITNGVIKRKVIGRIPEHPLALMQQVKQYERLVIEGVKNHSYSLCLQALTIHPLVMDEVIAKKILDDFIQVFKNDYPILE